MKEEILWWCYYCYYHVWFEVNYLYYCCDCVRFEASIVYMVFPSGSVVKNLPAMKETQFSSLGGEESLEEDMATYTSIIAWRIPMDRGAWRAAVHRVAKGQTRLKRLNTHSQGRWKKKISRSDHKNSECNNHNKKATKKLRKNICHKYDKFK